MSMDNNILVEQFKERIATMDIQQLTQLKQSYNRAMAAGKSPLGNIHVDYAVLNELRKLIATKEAEEARLPLTPERSLQAEAEALAKAHHVSMSVAKRFLEKRDRRGPLDVPRQHVKDAPDPEPVEPQREQRHERPNLREYNRFNTNKNEG